MVRVLNRDTEERTLIKGMAGPVVDLAFSHSLSEVLVGAVDSLGSLFVYRVLEQSNGLRLSLASPHLAFRLISRLRLKTRN